MEQGRAELLADADRPGGWVLLIDRIRQSYVDLDDPTYLDFEYMRTLADVLDALPEGPLTVTHIGGGALSLPRYIAATRPGSAQIVLEPDAELTTFVRAQLPLPRGARIRVRQTGGREGLVALRDASASVIVLDAFDGGRVPANLTTGECVAELARVLGPAGLLLGNLADGPQLKYLRRVLATLRQCLPNAVVIADSAVLRGRRFGNVEVVASAGPLPMEQIERRAASAMFPLRVVHGDALGQLIGGAAPLTDADPMRSPAPPEQAWRVSDE